jgi:uncharacterized membrane protein YagU involved in acid resistance
MSNKIKTILAAGLTAGILDITAAIVIYSMVLDVITPQQIFQSIAAGIHGKAVYDGSWYIALVGLFIHFMIALIFAAIFVMLYPALRKLISNKFILGIVYGILVWIAMNYIVVPHSAIARWPKLSWEFTKTPLAVLIIIVCVGLPISVITAKMYRFDSLIR